MAALAHLGTGGQALGIPLLSLMQAERRHGADTWVVKKSLVDTQSPAFRFFADRRHLWAKQDCFSSPGPRQMWGPLSCQMPHTVALDQAYLSLQFAIGHPRTLRAADG